METENLDLRSEEVQEILGRPPRWIVRWGIAVICAIVVGLFVGGYFIKYPDVVSATITVTTEHLPAGVMAHTTGKIDTLLVSEHQQVQQGELLGVLENSAHLEDILLMQEAMDSLPAVTTLKLGDLQGYYASFLKAREDYSYFIQADYHNKKIKSIQQQIRLQQQLYAKTNNQLRNGREMLDVAHRRFVMDSTLFTQKALSLADYQTARGNYLSQLQSFESLRMASDNQQVSILQLKQSLFDLEQQRNEEEQGLSLALATARDQLLSQLKTWERSYLLCAPIDGEISMTKYWQKNQNVSAGEIIVTVVPCEKTRIIGKILLPSQGAGKVKAGQIANVKFDSYPYMEYGMMKVAIRNISLVPISDAEGNKNYILEVLFPDSLVTTYGKTLDFSQEMTGTAEIITDDLRLIDRFINPVKAVLTR